MSFLTRTSTTTLRSLRFSTSRTAAFSTSVRHQKSAVDATKDVLKKVDRAAGDAAAKGIEVGRKLQLICLEFESRLADHNIENAAAKTKETVGIKSGPTQGEAAELLF